MSARRFFKVLAGIGVGAAATGATMIGLKGPITSSVCAKLPGLDRDHCVKAVAVEMNSAAMCESITGAAFGVSIDGGPKTVIENPPKMECLSQVAARTNDPSICDRVEGLLIAKTKIDCLYDVAIANSNAAACDAIGADEHSRAGQRMNAANCRALIGRPKDLVPQGDEDPLVRVTPREVGLPQCPDAKTDHELEATAIPENANPEKIFALPDGHGGVTFFPKMVVEVADGDTIHVPNGYEVTVRMPGVTMNLEPNTTFRIPCKEIDREQWYIFQEKGIMQTNTEYQHQFPAGTRTKDAIAGTKGTKYVSQVTDESTRFFVIEGAIEVSSINTTLKPVTVTAGQMVDVNGVRIMSPRAFSESELPKGTDAPAPARVASPPKEKTVFVPRLGHIPYALAYGGAGLAALSLLGAAVSKKKKPAEGGVPKAGAAMK